MKNLLLALFLLPVLAKAQKNSFIITPEYVKPADAYEGRTGGLHVAGLHQLYKGLYAGVSIDILGHTGVHGVYHTFAANLIWHTAKDEKKISGLVVVEPGYSPYKNFQRSIGRGSSDITYKGGSTFFGGAGFQTGGKHHVQAIVMVGYASYTISRTAYATKESLNQTGPGIRAGIVLR